MYRFSVNQNEQCDHKFPKLVHNLLAQTLPDENKMCHTICRYIAIFVGSKSVNFSIDLLIIPYCANQNNECAMLANCDNMKCTRSK